MKSRCDASACAVSGPWPWHLRQQEAICCLGAELGGRAFRLEYEVLWRWQRAYLAFGFGALAIRGEFDAAGFAYAMGDSDFDFKGSCEFPALWQTSGLEKTLEGTHHSVVLCIASVVCVCNRSA